MSDSYYIAAENELSEDDDYDDGEDDPYEDDADWDFEDDEDEA